MDGLAVRRGRGEVRGHIALLEHKQVEEFWESIILG